MAKILKNPYALYKGRLVMVDEIGSEKDPNEKFYCPACHSELIPKRGKIKVHHFAHKGNFACDKAFETALQYFAFDILKDNGLIFIPKLSFKKIELEPDQKAIIKNAQLTHYLDETIPEIEIQTDRGKLLLIVTQTRNLNRRHFRKLKELNIPTIRIDLSDFDYALEREEFKNFTLNLSKRKEWIYHPYLFDNFDIIHHFDNDLTKYYRSYDSCLARYSQLRPFYNKNLKFKPCSCEVCPYFFEFDHGIPLCFGSFFDNSINNASQFLTFLMVFKELYRTKEICVETGPNQYSLKKILHSEFVLIDDALGFSSLFLKLQLGDEEILLTPIVDRRDKELLYNTYTQDSKLLVLDLQDQDLITKDLIAHELQTAEHLVRFKSKREELLEQVLSQKTITIPPFTIKSFRQELELVGKKELPIEDIKVSYSDESILVFKIKTQGRVLKLLVPLTDQEDFDLHTQPYEPTLVLTNFNRSNPTIYLSNWRQLKWENHKMDKLLDQLFPKKKQNRKKNKKFSSIQFKTLLSQMVKEILEKQKSIILPIVTSDEINFSNELNDSYYLKVSPAEIFTIDSIELLLLDDDYPYLRLNNKSRSVLLDLALSKHNQIEKIRRVTGHELEIYSLDLKDLSLFNQRNLEQILKESENFVDVEFWPASKIGKINKEKLEFISRKTNAPCPYEKELDLEDMNCSDCPYCLGIHRKEFSKCICGAKERRKSIFDN